MRATMTIPTPRRKTVALSVMNTVGRGVKKSPGDPSTTIRTHNFGKDGAEPRTILPIILLLITHQEVAETFNSFFQLRNPGEGDNSEVVGSRPRSEERRVGEGGRPERGR